MEPAGNIILGAMWKVVSATIKAAKTARRNKAMCRELTLRAKGVKGVLREYRKVASGGDAATTTTRRILQCRLKAAIDDALKLAESCGRRSRSNNGGLLYRLQLHRLVASDGLAAKLDDVNGRITSCLVDLQAAIAVRSMMDNHRRANNPVRENNGGKGGRWRRGNNKAAGQPRRRHRAVDDVAGVPICHVHHHFMIEEEGSTSFSVM
uniref:Uncharacterized protein n=1 Tax=Oryza meridionalis TaxID=40149 RepID=A0A0E0F8F2_9ORYZ